MKTAILIAAHNEELGIGRTIRSVIDQADVFVASDNSTDGTVQIARGHGATVIQVSRGGKGRAIRSLIERCNILDRYDAFLIIDADTIVGRGAVKEFEKALANNAGAVGRIESGNRGLVSYWRAVQHYMTAKMYRRGMAATGCIHIMSGTCAIWSTKAMKQITFEDTPVEDMDWTYQIHRKKLGRIAYAPGAIVYTQEPLTLGDYSRQMIRWFRGYWLTTAKYNAPFGGQSLDFGQALFMFEIAVNWARLIAMPLAAIGIAPRFILWSLVYDALVIGLFAAGAAIQARNWRILAYLPGVAWFYLFDMVLNIWSILTYRKLTSGTWKSPARLRMTLNQKGA